MRQKSMLIVPLPGLDVNFLSSSVVVRNRFMSSFLSETGGFALILVLCKRWFKPDISMHGVDHSVD